MSIRICAIAAGVAGATLWSGIAAAEDLPTRKPGLWESSMKAGKDGDPAMTAKQCVDATTDKAMLMGTAKGLCDFKWQRAARDRIETEATCRMGPVIVTGKGVITGDFNSSLRIETTATTTASADAMPAGAPRIAIPTQTQTTVMEARWLGPCEPGQKPGDVIMPDGKVIPTAPNPPG